MTTAALRIGGIAMVLAAAAALRLAGWHWGLPDASHPEYSYHPDETALLLWADWLAQGQVIARQFIFGGTLYSSILNACILLAEPLGGVLGGVNLLADAILLSRGLAILCAVLTVWLVYLIGRRLFGTAAGLIGAAALALAPGHVFLSATNRPDALAALVATMFLYLALPALQPPLRGHARTFVLTGALLGAAVALRFPIAAFAIAPVAAYVLRATADRSFGLGALARLLALCGGVALASYALTSPHTLLYPEVVLDGLKTTWTYESSVFLDAVGRGPRLYQYGWTIMIEALGAPLYALALAALATALRRRAPGDVLVLVAGLPYFVLMVVATWVVVRYTLPLLPLLALLIGAAAAQWLARGRLARGITVVILVAAGAVTLLHDTAFARIVRGTDVRDAAAAWIRQTLPPGAGLVTVRQYAADVYFLPPLGNDALALVLAEGVDAGALLEDPRATHLIVHENVYHNLDRLREAHPSSSARSLLATLESGHYTLLREFKRPVVAGGLDFSRSFEALDYRVINPGIRIYRRAAVPAPVSP